MTRAEADRRCVELNEEAVDGAEGRWLAQEAPLGEWRPVLVRVPGLKAKGPLKAEVETRSRAEEQDDPRPAVFRNMPPYGGAG